MLLNILIADDEYFIRQRIKKIIPWDELNLRFAGEASNGIEVLDFLDKAPVDILLLDIKMPKMDGLEVCEYIYNHYPHIKTIILSGYNDFEYARTTMRFRVMDYLLKPVVPEALKASLQICMDKILVETKQKLQLEKYQHYEKCTALTGVLNKTHSFSDCRQAYRELEHTSYCLYLGVYCFDDGEIAIRNLVLKLLNMDIICEYFKEMDYTYVVQLFLEKPGDTDHLGSTLAEFTESSRSYLFLTASRVFSVLDDWSLYYKRVLYLLGCRYFSSRSTFWLESDMPDPKEASLDLSKLREQLLYYLNGGDTTGFTGYLDTLFEEIKAKKNPLLLPLIVTECFVTFRINFGYLPDYEGDIKDYVSMLIDEEYQLEPVKNAVAGCGLHCINQNEPAPSDVSLSNKLIAYVLEHYADPELSVAKAADVFQLNASYISSLFKKVNSLSLLQYITKVRLEKSKLLLEENQYKISDIAEMTGYSDVFYFSKRFKKMYGCSPKEYAHRKGSKG